MAYDQRPGQDGQLGRPASEARSLSPRWQDGQPADTRRLEPYGVQQGYGQATRPYPQSGDDGRWRRPPEWQYAQHRDEQGNAQRGYSAGQPQSHTPPPPRPLPQPGQRGSGPPPPPPPPGNPQEPPYQAPRQPPDQEPYRPSRQSPHQGPYPAPYRGRRRGEPWPARHKVLTGLLGLIALIIVIVAANSGGSPAPTGSSTTAGLTTPTAAASATAAETPSQHPTHAAVVHTAPPVTSQITPTASHAPTTRTSAPVAPPPSSATSAGCHPLTSGGKCYAPGEYCPSSDHGATGVAGNGEAITCENNKGWRWEPS